MAPVVPANNVISLRAQDFHEGLRDVKRFGPMERDLRKTLLIGKAATLATHLKGLLQIDDYESLVYLAAELGISSLELPAVLRELEVVDFATVVKATGDEIKRLELRVPELRKNYGELGARWKDLKPTEREKAALAVLQSVIELPRLEAEVLKEFGLAPGDLDGILDLTSQGALVERFQDAGGEATLYSPLTMEQHPRLLVDLTKKFPESEVAKALKMVKGLQGIPDGLGPTKGNLVIQTAARTGVLCPVTIATPKGDKQFLFTPYGGLKEDERVILDKARAILACVRFGEHFSDKFKVKFPSAIIRTLRDRKTFKYPRPDVPEQYGLLVTKQVGFVEKDLNRTGFFHFKIHDTEENRRALNVALELAEEGSTSSTMLDVDAATSLDVAGSYGGALPTRTRLAKSPKVSKAQTREIVSQLSKLARGVIPQ